MNRCLLIDAAQVFADRVDLLVRAAKRDGTFDMGVMELGGAGSKIKEGAPVEVLYTDPETNSDTCLNTIEVDRGLEWEDVLAVGIGFTCDVKMYWRDTGVDH